MEVGPFRVQLSRGPSFPTKGRDPPAGKEPLSFQVNSLGAAEHLLRARAEGKGSEPDRCLPSGGPRSSARSWLSPRSYLTRFFFFLEGPSPDLPLLGEGTPGKRGEEMNPC